MTGQDTLTTKQFEVLARFIRDHYGIKINTGKKLMLESRIRKRMKDARYNSFTHYLDYVFSPEGMAHELVHMIDVVTTNKTQFFREPGHFDLLVKSVVPQITARGKVDVHVWSAACSTGEEPYTLAMVLAEAASQNRHLTFSILASDLSTKVLKKAYQGVFQEDQAQDIPLHMRKKYLLKSKDKSLKLVRIEDLLRKKVTFRRINLMSSDFGIREKIHIIFCRNVMIYFPKDKQERLIRRFYQILEPGGFLFIGHSESIIGINVPFIQVVPTVYRKGGGALA